LELVLWNTVVELLFARQSDSGFDENGYAP
jgi:hypothetical protein